MYQEKANTRQVSIEYPFSYASNADSFEKTCGKTSLEQFQQVAWTVAKCAFNSERLYKDRNIQLSELLICVVQTYKKPHTTWRMPKQQTKQKGDLGKEVRKTGKRG